MICIPVECDPFIGSDVVQYNVLPSRAEEVRFTKISVRQKNTRPKMEAISFMISLEFSKNGKKNNKFSNVRDSGKSVNHELGLI